MAHYAFLDDNNIVTEVIVGANGGSGVVIIRYPYSA